MQPRIPVDLCTTWHTDAHLSPLFPATPRFPAARPADGAREDRDTEAAGTPPTTAERVAEPA